jgi:5-methylcytosine-specific restriction endonuclease McrA
LAKDPRSSHRYRKTRAEYLRTAHHACCLCGKGVDPQLPPGYPGSPTIEHRLPVRRILAMTTTWEEAVALACDTSWWGVAHKGCQDAQGGRASHENDQRPTGVRAWGE